MLLYLSSVIALVALAPLAAGDDCQCQFTGMSGKVFLHTEPRGLHVLRPYVSEFEVNYDLGQAFFYPPSDDFKNNSVYIQDLETNTMYIYPYENGIRTGNCMKVNMPKELIVPSCMPASWENFNSTIPGEHVFVPNINSKTRQSHYRVDNNDPCEVHMIFQHYNDGKGNISFIMIVTLNGLDFSNTPPRFMLDTQNCQEEDLRNLFYKAF